MPVGRWKTFQQCEAYQIKQGKSPESAAKICGAIENNMREASTNIKYEDNNNHLFIKAFLLDATVNINSWGVSPASLDQHINTFIGKPLVLTENFKHPLPPEIDKVATNDDDEEYDDDKDPYNTLKVDDIVDHWLQYQEKFRIGSIIDVTEKKGTYYAIIEITDPAAKDAFRNNDLPLFVSPAIAQLDPREDPANITNWTGIHLSVVQEPAYTIKKAIVSGQCHGESERCVLQLRQAAIERKEIPRLCCGFCRTGALARYAEIVKSWRTKHSVYITKSPEAFTNSSFGFSNGQIKTEGLTDQQNNNNNNNTTTNDTNKQQDFERVQKEQGGDLGEQQQQQKKSKTTTTTTDERQGAGDGDEQAAAATKSAAEEVAVKVAGMAECVQIFQQNGVQDPQQAQQICKLAAQALMENQQNQQQPPSGGGAGGGFGGRSQGAPRGTGQFGSVTEYEKELAKYEAKVADLTEQLKTYKKGDKTDAQRIAELEDTVTNLNRAYKEKELEAYLVTKIADEELRNKKIKRFAELNLTIDDVKDIYPPATEAATKGTTTVKKIAEVQQQESSPISRVKLQVASSSNNNNNGEEQQQQDTKTNNDVRARNNKILSSLLSKGGIY